MLSKRFYNILTIIYIILIIVLFLLNYYLTFNAILGAFESKSAEEAINKMGEGSPALSLIKILMYVLPTIYYIFILVLAIQLHSRKHLSMLNTVVIAIIAPLAPFFYIFTLRKALKEYENKERNITNIQQTPTQY